MRRATPARRCLHAPEERGRPEHGLRVRTTRATPRARSRRASSSPTGAAILEDPATGSACANLGGWFSRDAPGRGRHARGLAGRRDPAPLDALPRRDARRDPRRRRRGRARPRDSSRFEDRSSTCTASSARRSRSKAVMLGDYLRSQCRRHRLRRARAAPPPGARHRAGRGGVRAASRPRGPHAGRQLARRLLRHGRGRAARLPGGAAQSRRCIRTRTSRATSGTQTNLYTGETFELTQAHVDELRELDVAPRSRAPSATG